MTISPPTMTPAATRAPDRHEIRAAAEAVETQFLTEMLSHAGLGAREGAFGGGEGESQFASLLVRQQAESMVAAGGIGLAERLFHAIEASYVR